MAEGRSATARRQRVDAAANRAKLLAAAREVFDESGPDASLNEIAKRAGVGSATLYRHFPTLQALLAAIVLDSVDALCAYGTELLGAADPDVAWRTWLRAFADHAASMNGLPATQQLAAARPDQDNPLADCHRAIRSTAAALLARARQEGHADRQTDVEDVLRLVSAIAWASRQTPDEPGVIDRLFAIPFPSSLRATF